MKKLTCVRTQGAVTRIPNTFLNSTTKCLNIIYFAVSQHIFNAEEKIVFYTRFMYITYTFKSKEP
jgi:hypothetical protein